MIVNLGGLRFDPYGPEAQAWKEYGDIVAKSRHELYRQITDATLDDRQYAREAKMTVNTHGKLIYLSVTEHTVSPRVSHF